MRALHCLSVYFSNRPFSLDRLQSWVLSATAQEPTYEFDLSGGVLCLDFANTVSWRQLPKRATDYLQTYDDFVAFAVQSKVLSPGELREVEAYSRRHARQAKDVLRRALACRESIYRAFSAVAGEKAAPPDDLRQISDFAVEALNHRRLVRADGEYRWEWDLDGEKILDRVMWPIAQSAADLLTSAEVRALRMCEAPGCAWLFLDHSRNRSRRWCDMKVCGNREKARRHYRRTRG
jgi:predicted RNA-binding Zn ribbon-like protein